MTNTERDFLCRKCKNVIEGKTIYLYDTNPQKIIGWFDEICWETTKGDYKGKTYKTKVIEKPKVSERTKTKKEIVKEIQEEWISNNKREIEDKLNAEVDKETVKIRKEFKDDWRGQILGFERTLEDYNRKLIKLEHEKIEANIPFSKIEDKIVKYNWINKKKYQELCRSIREIFGWGFDEFPLKKKILETLTTEEISARKKLLIEMVQSFAQEKGLKITCELSDEAWNHKEEYVYSYQDWNKETKTTLINLRLDQDNWGLILKSLTRELAFAYLAPRNKYDRLFWQEYDETGIPFVRENWIHPEDINLLDALLKLSTNKSEPVVEVYLQASLDTEETSWGTIELLLTPEKLDEAWVKIRQATINNRLGISARVETMLVEKEKYLLVIDTANKEEEKRVREELIKLGFSEEEFKKENEVSEIPIKKSIGGGEQVSSQLEKDKSLLLEYINLMKRDIKNAEEVKERLKEPNKIQKYNEFQNELGTQIEKVEDLISRLDNWELEVNKPQEVVKKKKGVEEIEKEIEAKLTKVKNLEITEISDKELSDLLIEFKKIRKDWAFSDNQEQRDAVKSKQAKLKEITSRLSLEIRLRSQRNEWEEIINKALEDVNNKGKEWHLPLSSFDLEEPDYIDFTYVLKEKTSLEEMNKFGSEITKAIGKQRQMYLDLEKIFIEGEKIIKDLGKEENIEQEVEKAERFLVYLSYFQQLVDKNEEEKRLLGNKIGRVRGLENQINKLKGESVQQAQVVQPPKNK